LPIGSSTTSRCRWRSICPCVEHYVRQDDGSWRVTETDGLDTEIALPRLDAALPLSEVYLDVSFESDENQ
jgi:hypothetical protein